VNIIHIVDVGFLQDLGDVSLTTRLCQLTVRGYSLITYSHVHLHQRVICQILVRVGPLVVLKVLETAEAAAQHV
jgi:hypothetical protein